MATGLLVLGIGRATKLLTYLVGCNKTYAATVRLGQDTVTDDAEGEVTGALGASDLAPDTLAQAVAALTGDIRQVPSSVSAIKVDGVRSYARVRGGEQVALAARPVQVARFEVLDRRAAVVEGVPVIDLVVVVQVSSGTYVRALARDLGARLGTGGHLTALRRTSVGRFDVADAPTLDRLVDLLSAGDPLPVTPMAIAARAQFPVRELSAQDALRLRQGKQLATPWVTDQPVAGIGPGEDLVAMLDQSGPHTRSRVVFPA